MKCEKWHFVSDSASPPCFNEVLLRKLSFFILQLTIVHALVSCASVRRDPVSVNSVAKYTKLAIEKYHNNITYQANLSHSYILCSTQSRATGLNPFPTVKYFVYDIKHDKVLFEDSVAKGSIKWLNDDQFQVSTVPGIVRIDEGANGQLRRYIYDVLLQKKIFVQGDKVNYR